VKPESAARRASGQTRFLIAWVRRHLAGVIPLKYEKPQTHLKGVATSFDETQITNTQFSIFNTQSLPWHLLLDIEN